jgi:hypothetical protein
MIDSVASLATVEGEAAVDAPLRTHGQLPRGHRVVEHDGGIRLR